MTSMMMVLMLMPRPPPIGTRIAAPAREAEAATAALAAAILDIVAWTFVVEPHSPASQIAVTAT